jgi:hypothetical protein
MGWLHPATIERLANDPARCMSFTPSGPIDLSKPFVPEEYTQLFYTPLYAGLHREHRLRYNQLFGVRINEYIMMLEADLVERLLLPLSRHAAVSNDPTLRRCIATMIEEEKQHYRCFAELNCACFPALYRDRDRYFSILPLAARVMLAGAGLVAGQLAFALWYLMAMEESSTALAREITRQPATGTLGAIEPNFAAVHREHMKDETRHLQIDGLLIDLILKPAGAVKRKLNATLFKLMLGPVTRPTRAGSGVKVVRELVRQMPELSWHEEAMVDAIMDLADNRPFQESLFNRAAMPLTFGVFDRTAEFATLEEAMTGYDRR